MGKKLSFEIRLTLLSLVSSISLFVFLLLVMIYAGISIPLILLTVLFGSMLVFYINYRIYQKLVYQFRSLNNLLDAMIQGDYSLRARSDNGYGELDEVVASVNGLARRLSQQRSEAVESHLLLNTVIDHIDVAIVALTDGNRISFFNPAAKKLLLLGKDGSDRQLLDQLRFLQSFSGGHNQVVELSLGRQRGRFNVHVEEFREAGVQCKLLFITDVRTLLRGEERKAWQSLVRVISHEINNSLSPIASISQTLSRLIDREGIEEARYQKDLIDGLKIITERANGLRSFVDSYKQLARLPEPKMQAVSVADLFDKIRMLFKKQSVVIESTVDFQLQIDPVQFEQVLINLFKNSVESMSKVNPEGLISVSWRIVDSFFVITICDQGAGITNPDNLFIPFYSTKKNGSGIGLLLCRQVVEAHNGRLEIANRTDCKGCCATIEIPCREPESILD